MSHPSKFSADKTGIDTTFVSRRVTKLPLFNVKNICLTYGLDNNSLDVLETPERSQRSAVVENPNIQILK